MKAPLLLLSLATLAPAAVRAQGAIENVIVETYYISDANDATDTIGGTLAEGSHTYRVFLDLAPGHALRSIYGDAHHPLVISSTADFFNNLDRGRTWGHEINNGALDENTVALDSWLSMGAASTQRFGILKADDPDGSQVGGANNDGGSAELPGGLLANTDAGAGIPLTEQDGLVPLGGGQAQPPSFSALGDTVANVFGDTTVASSFVSHNVRIGCSSPGVTGPTADNRILIAQLTTTGTLTFALNVEVQAADGTITRYVADGDTLLAGETPSGLLSYPPACGCMDPNFLEYDPGAGCDDGSCLTPIVFGCMDTSACNFDHVANFHVSQLCCYGPGDCNGLDIAIVCPNVGIIEAEATAGIEVFPNPAHDRLFLRTQAPQTARTRVMVYDPSGRAVLEADVGVLLPGTPVGIDVSVLSPGLYVVRTIGAIAPPAVTIVKE